MFEVILVHANCISVNSKGDYAFAGKIARDLFFKLAEVGLQHIKVILISEAVKLVHFQALYGSLIHDSLFDDAEVGLSSLEEFDAVNHRVIAFIEASRCNPSPAHLVKRVLSPDSKLLIVGNANRPDAYVCITLLEKKSFYQCELSSQGELYDLFSLDNILITAAGFGTNRLGLTSLPETANLPALTHKERVLDLGLEMAYGFIYIVPSSMEDYYTIADYIVLTELEQYYFVGHYDQEAIRETVIPILDLEDFEVASLRFRFFPSLSHLQMRHLMTEASTDLVLTTGVESTIEAMRDNKLPYYQYRAMNENFVRSYLTAIRTLIFSDPLLGNEETLDLLDLLNFLFQEKPLSRKEGRFLQELYLDPSISAILKAKNRILLNELDGILAPQLLEFIFQPNYALTLQFARVMKRVSEQERGEKSILMHVAYSGQLLELKILIPFQTLAELNQQDPVYLGTALHWAVVNQQLDCARLLVKSGAFLHVRDFQGFTAYELAQQHCDPQKIAFLDENQASEAIKDRRLLKRSGQRNHFFASKRTVHSLESGSFPQQLSL